jgi:hypothetical protein
MFADVELMSFDLDVPDQVIRNMQNIQVWGRIDRENPMRPISGVYSYGFRLASNEKGELSERR